MQVAHRDRLQRELNASSRERNQKPLLAGTVR
jgi:hypothetical protein